MSEAKEEMRRVLLARRAAMPEAERRRASEEIARRVASFGVYRDASLILAYYPVREEVDLKGLYEAALKAGKTLAFPRCEGKRMVFCAVRSPDALVPGAYSIPAPAPDAPALTDFDHALCLIPALSVDRAGNRLGYGGGYYDRFLEDKPGIRCLCPLYDALLSESIVPEPFDRRVQAVVTEKREWSFYEA